MEMLFHAKALEVFTLAYQSIQNVDEEEDLEVSRCYLWPRPDVCSARYSSGTIAHRPHPPTDPASLAWPPPCPPFIPPLTICCFLFFFCLFVFVRSLPSYFCQRPEDKTNKSAAGGGGRLAEPTSSAPLPFHLCTFVLNHLPFIHVEVKLLAAAQAFFSTIFFPLWLR